MPMIKQKRELPELRALVEVGNQCAMALSTRDAENFEARKIRIMEWDLAIKNLRKAALAKRLFRPTPEACYLAFVTSATELPGGGQVMDYEAFQAAIEKLVRGAFSRPIHEPAELEQ